MNTMNGMNDPEALLPVHVPVPPIYSYSGIILPEPPNPFTCEHGFSITEFRCTSDPEPLAFKEWQYS